MMNEPNEICETISPANEAQNTSQDSVVPDDIPTPKPHKKRRLSRVVLGFYAFFAVSLAFFIVCLCSPAFADGFNRTASAAIRTVLAHLTGWLPFSLAEYLLLLAPIVLFLLIRYGVKHFSSSWRDVGRYCLSLLSVLALVGGLFLSAFAPGYHGSTLDQKLGLEKREVSTKELYDTARVLVSQMERELDEISFSPSGFSIMPYTLDEMNDRLLLAFDTVSAAHDFLPVLKSRVKPVMMSEAMSYTHITGVYTFFTGEANLNVAFPDYTIPYTAAHELAHQRGVAREDEANFVAFLVCIAAEDAYIRYCGYRNLYDHVISALYEADPSQYAKLNGYVPRAIRREQSAYSAFFDPYRDSAASQVTETVNDTFLTIQGTEGTKSYGMVVDLAVAYYRLPDEATSKK